MPLSTWSPACWTDATSNGPPETRPLNVRSSASAADAIEWPPGSSAIVGNHDEFGRAHGCRSRFFVVYRKYTRNTGRSFGSTPNYAADLKNYLAPIKY